KTKSDKAHFSPFRRIFISVLGAVVITTLVFLITWIF
ncbi:MAG: hypothetical protein ACI83I_002630, partial [Bacteroidia bacterium]